jgi:hypothetical protein
LITAGHGASDPGEAIECAFGIAEEVFGYERERALLHDAA